MGLGEEKIFLSFSHYKSIGVNDTPGRGQFGPQGLDWQIGPQGLDWQDLCRRPLNIATYLIC